MNDFQQIMIAIPITQVVFVIMIIIFTGIMNDDDIKVKKKSALLWCIPYILPVVYIFKGFINGIKRLK